MSKFLDKLLKADIPNSLGDTQSGKPVLGAGQESYSQGFNEQDHLDAKKIHEDKAAQAEKKVQTKMLSSTGKMPLKQIAQAQNDSAKQRDVAEWHKQESANSEEDGEAKQIKENAKLEAQQNMQKAKKEKFKQQLSGGLADKKKLSDFDKPSLMEGQQVEMEHTDDPEKALEIAMDHLTEDKEYYKKLKTIEKSEGSRGGKVVGYTKSGKPIYAASDVHHLTSVPLSAPDHKHVVVHGEGMSKKAATEHAKKLEAEGHNTSVLPDKSGKKRTVLTYHKDDQINKSVPKEEYKYPKEQECDWEEEAKKERQSKEEDQVKAPSHITGSFSLKKSFLEKLTQENLDSSDKSVGPREGFIASLIKGGPGSGKKGHMTAKKFQPRKPYPGEEAHNMTEYKPNTPTFRPAGGYDPHYSDDPAIGAYKKFIKHLKNSGKDFEGHISFDKKSGNIIPISKKGEEHIVDAKAKLAELSGETSEPKKD